MNSNTKNKSVLVTLVLTVLMLIAGTFAWSSISQRVLNKDEGTHGNAGGRVHDDYNRTSGNKDIYAENFGDRNLVVRIKLSEFLERNGQSIIPNVTKEDRNNWTNFVLPVTSIPTREFRKYITWELGGEKIYLPTFNTNEDNKETDAAGDAIDFLADGPTVPSEISKGEHAEFTEGEEVYSPDDSKVSKIAKKTNKEDRIPISMADWTLLENEEDKIGNYWIIDEDGWAYWANILKPNEASSLLLSNIDFNTDSFDSWYYGIDVIGEFTTIEDTDLFKESEYGAPSTNANEIIANIKKEEYVFEFNFDPNNISVVAGEKQQLEAKILLKNINGTEEIQTDDLVWSLEEIKENNAIDGSKTTISSTGELTVQMFERSEIKLNIESEKYNLNQTINIKISEPKGANFKFFGEDYIYLYQVEEDSFLIQRKAHLPSQTFNSVAYNESMMDRANKAYYEQLSELAKEIVQPVQKMFNVGSGGSSSNRLVAEVAPDDFAEITLDGEKKAFSLSLAEVSKASGPGQAFTALNGKRGSTVRIGLRTSQGSVNMWSLLENTGAFYGYGYKAIKMYTQPALIVKP